MPSEDAIVAAVVGSGGTASERARVERAARELLLPSLRQEPDLRALLRRLREEKEASEAYDTSHHSRAERVVRVCVVSALSDLRYRSMLLAEHRLHILLWPTEPIPELWDGVNKLEPLPSPEAIAKAASTVEDRVRLIEQRYGVVNGGEERLRLLILNNVHVAKTGDHSKTIGPVYDELRARGIETLPLPGANPW